MGDNNFEMQLYNAYLDGSLSDYAFNEIIRIHHDIFLQNNKNLSSFISSSHILNKTENKNLVFHGAKPQYIEKANKSSPKVSVIIPTYNRSEMLCRCIESILMQNYKNIEIFIIDDCSTDDTKEKVEHRYQNNKNVIYQCNEKNLGPGGNRQKAYQQVSGEYIVFADDDDFYIEPDFFIKAVALFLEYNNIAMVCANSIVCDFENKKFKFLPLTFCGIMKKEQYFLGFSSIYRKPNSTFPTMLKKTALDSADFGNMWMMNDTSIYLRTLCFGDVCVMRDWVGVYYVHNSNISKFLQHEFIIENLDEKTNIYQMAKKQFFKPINDWYYTQLMVTIKYYLQSKKIGFRYFMSLILWILKNGTGIRRKLLYDTLKCQYRVVRNY